MYVNEGYNNCTRFGLYCIFVTTCKIPKFSVYPGNMIAVEFEGSLIVILSLSKILVIGVFFSKVIPSTDYIALKDE